MRLSASEKREIIRLVDCSELGVNKTLRELGIPKSTFYKWYKAYLERGSNGLHPARKTRRQWNSIPAEQRQLVVEVALDYPQLSPRELAVKITDEQRIFISESSVYRILKAGGLITTPAHILLSASNEFRDKTAFLCTRCGKPTLPTSRCWVGVGITCRPFWMIIAAISYTGSSVKP